MQNKKYMASHLSQEYVISNLCKVHDQPAFVSDGCTGGGHRPVRGELYKQVTSSAEHTLIGQILYLVRVVHRGRVYVVAVLNEQPRTHTHTHTEKRWIKIDVSEP